MHCNDFNNEKYLLNNWIILHNNLLKSWKALTNILGYKFKMNHLRKNEDKSGF